MKNYTVDLNSISVTATSAEEAMEKVASMLSKDYTWACPMEANEESTEEFSCWKCGTKDTDEQQRFCPHCGACGS